MTQFTATPLNSPLGEMTGHLEAMMAALDYAKAAAYIERHILECWYGLSPVRFREILTELFAAGETGTGLLQLMGLFVGSTEPERFDRIAEDASMPELDMSRDMLMLAAGVFDLRLQGRPVDALEASRALDARGGTLRPLYDAHNGWALFGAVQHGVTAMLAGEFEEALTSFTKAHRHVEVPTLSFLRRDAYVRKAMLHAVFGDRETAQQLIEESDRVPRTESWVETILDADRTMVAALVATDDLTESLRMLESIPPEVIGELWPFHASAMQLVLQSLDSVPRAQQHVERLAGLALPRTPGQGYSGSVLEINSAMNALAHGDLARARDAVAGADQKLNLTRICLGLIELVAGRPREALQAVSGLHTSTAHLRSLSLRRIGIIAGAYIELGERTECGVALESTLRHTDGGIRPDDLRVFPPSVRNFARMRVPGWPADAAPTGGIRRFDLPDRGSVLSERELEVLKQLASGKSREHMARSMFVSLNTLKAHLSSVYRKLGVKSKAAAVLEAERRGLI